MVFRRPRGFIDSRRFSVSEWADAPIDPITGDDPTHTTHGDSAGSSLDRTALPEEGGVEVHRDGASPPPPPSSRTESLSGPPEMNLGAIVDAINTTPKTPRNDDVDSITGAGSPPPQNKQIDHPLDESFFSVGDTTAEGGGTTPGGGGGGNNKLLRRTSTGGGGHPGRRASINKLFHRKASTDLTVAPLSSASRTSYSSSAGTNIWTKLLGGNDLLWDGIDGKDAFDDTDEYDAYDEDNDELNSLDNFDSTKNQNLKTCRNSLRRVGLAYWYEVRHFVTTVMKHPHIWLISGLAFGILCGVGMMAVNAERDRFVKKQMMTADFIARETGEWFSNEFRKAMLPLYAVQQGVVHSQYFDDAAIEIGRFPNRVIPETMNEMKIMRNVSGICDDPDLQLKWREIVEPVNQENDLDGVVFAYRLAPMNVFCLYERANMESPDKNYGFDVGSSTQVKFWQGVTEGIFLHNEFSMYGPFSIPDKKEEVICGHIPVYKTGTQGLELAGEEVPEAWGFVMNYLDWGMLKDRSNIYERFSGCNLDFELTSSMRKENAYQNMGPFPESNVLAKSSDSHLLDETNSVVIETTSLHGVWSNRVGTVGGWNPHWYPAAVTAVVLGSLILAFLTASTLVERQLHRNLVNKMLPKRAIVKLHRGQTVLEKYNLVTIFFSDIVGFTSMAGSMRPIQVMKMLNELYTEMDKLVEKHQVYKVETIGDAYMVVGGAPDRVPAPLAAERVAMFALDATEFVRNFRTKDGDRVFIRAGLASGPVVAGVVGQAMPRYCFFGDTVNFASRMESTSKKMKVQVAEITYRLLKDAPNMNFTMSKRMDGDIAGVMIKGKGHQITYWAETAAQREYTKVVKMVDSPTHPQPSMSYSFESSSDIETPGYLPKLSETSESGPFSTLDASGSSADSAGYADFLKMLSATSARQDMSMYTSEEIYRAMSGQEWEKLGYAENVLVEATNDHAKMIVRASALLEHRLDRVLKHRDASAQMSTDVRLQISEFVGEVASTYTDDAKFHNLAHALHVTTSMNKLLSQTVVEDPLNSFVLVFSALVHDAGHTGMSNKILRETQHPLSKKFGEDVPIAERNSIDIGLKILFRDEFKELRMAILPDVLDKIEFIKIMFQGILCTDIASPTRVKLGLERFEVAQDEQGEYEHRLCPLVPYLDDIFDGVGVEENVKDEFPQEFVITHMGLQKCVRNEHLMLISDVSHLVQDWNVFVKWNFRLYKEIKNCSRQGFCPDPLDGWSAGQIGFLNHYILPLAKRSKIFFNKEFGDSLVENGMTNMKLWKQHGDKATSIMATGVELGEDESDVLLRLYELPTRALFSTAA